MCIISFCLNKYSKSLFAQNCRIGHCSNYAANSNKRKSSMICVIFFCRKLAVSHLNVHKTGKDSCSNNTKVCKLMQAKKKKQNHHI
jgi:hypothetical protein